MKLYKSASMQVSKEASILVAMYKTVILWIYLGMQVYKFACKEGCTFPSMQICKYVGMYMYAKVCKYLCTRVFIYASIQVCKVANM